jgi:hypothetical protein
MVLLTLRCTRLGEIVVAEAQHDPRAAGQRYPRRLVALVHADHADAQVVQLAHDPGADMAQPGHDDVVAHGPVLALEGPGQPGADRRLADDMPGVDGAAPGHVQGAARRNR